MSDTEIPTKITLTAQEEFSCELYENDRPKDKAGKQKEHYFEIQSLPCNLKFYIKPYKLTPLIRINNLLVNYGLAEITPWDHMIEINLNEDFFDRYFANIVVSKQKYLDIDSQTIKEKLGLIELTDLTKEIENNLK
tara:strand:- start:370 stop:777 length:408 start_codon:yes stop_codon:yes gene_type:complete